MPYSLLKVRGQKNKYYVVDNTGKHYSREPLTLARAKKQLVALHIHTGHGLCQSKAEVLPAPELAYKAPRSYPVNRDEVPKYMDMYKYIEEHGDINDPRLTRNFKSWSDEMYAYEQVWNELRRGGLPKISYSSPQAVLGYDYDGFYNKYFAPYLLDDDGSGVRQINSNYMPMYQKFVELKSKGQDPMLSLQVRASGLCQSKPVVETPTVKTEYQRIYDKLGAEGDTNAQMRLKYAHDTAVTYNPIRSGFAGPEMMSSGSIYQSVPGPHTQYNSLIEEYRMKGYGRKKHGGFKYHENNGVYTVVNDAGTVLHQSANKQEALNFFNEVMKQSDNSKFHLQHVIPTSRKRNQMTTQDFGELPEMTNIPPPGLHRPTPKRFGEGKHVYFSEPDKHILIGDMHRKMRGGGEYDFNKWYDYAMGQTNVRPSTFTNLTQQEVASINELLTQAGLPPFANSFATSPAAASYLNTPSPAAASYLNTPSPSRAPPPPPAPAQAPAQAPPPRQETYAEQQARVREAQAREEQQRRAEAQRQAEAERQRQAENERARARAEYEASRSPQVNLLEDLIARLTEIKSNPSTAKKHIQHIGSNINAYKSIITPQSITLLKSVARKALFTLHPDKGGDAEIFTALASILKDTGLGILSGEGLHPKKLAFVKKYLKGQGLPTTKKNVAKICNIMDVEGVVF